MASFTSIKKSFAEYSRVLLVRIFMNEENSLQYILVIYWLVMKTRSLKKKKKN